MMKIILSRKGFDTSSGGGPSPILPDGRLLSLPIPDRHAPLRYREITRSGLNLGPVVAALTAGRVPSTQFAHLDPDLVAGCRPRPAGWRPLFGQSGAAQGHLRNQGVGPGDLFLFFGLFRWVRRTPSGLAWDPGARPLHLLWGWLQVEAVIPVDARARAAYPWAAGHPHFHDHPRRNNTAYLARRTLSLPGLEPDSIPGAGIFPTFHERLVLTAPAAARPSRWQLPGWFHPEKGRPLLTYHVNPARWQKNGRKTLLEAVSRGQEFVFHGGGRPEAAAWIEALLAFSRSGPPSLLSSPAGVGNGRPPAAHRSQDREK